MCVKYGAVFYHLLSIVLIVCKAHLGDCYLMPAPSAHRWVVGRWKERVGGLSQESPANQIATFIADIMTAIVDNNII